MEILYRILPVFLQNLIISVYGYHIYKKRYGDEYKKWYNFFVSKDFSNYEQEKINQDSQLVDFLKYSEKHSPFYRELYKNIDISSIEKVEDLHILPIVDKEMLRSNIDKVYTISKKDSIVSFTGGTTGKSLQVFFSKKDFQKRMAYLDAFKNRLGIDVFNVKKATFSGRSIVYNSRRKVFWRHNYIYKQRLYSTFHLTNENIPFYLNDLNKFKPEILNGFVSAIYELAEFIKRTNSEVNFFPKAIFTTSETLLPYHREIIEDVFKCKIYDQYASAEGSPFITECNFGNLHYNLDTGVIETDENNNIIVTSFTTHGTPLIRYNIGDKVTFKNGECKCGSSHPLVEKIDGRKVDYLYSNSKGKISLSQLADVIKGNPNSIIKMQFVQNKEDEVEVKIVVDNTLFKDRHEETIMNMMKYRFGNETRIIITKVSEIPKEKSGKYSLIKNNINHLIN